MIHHVIWDFDGTLFDTYPVMAEAFREAIVAMDGPSAPSIGEIMAQMKITVGDAFRCFVTARGLDEKRFNALYKPMKARMEAESCAPFEAAKKLCRDVRRAGGHNYIFTHRSRSTLPLLEKFGMLGDFVEIVTAEDGFARKPAPDAIAYLLGKYAIERRDAIMIGDRELDILSGCNAGIHTCLLVASMGVQTAAERAVLDFSEVYGVLGLEKDGALA